MNESSLIIVEYMSEVNHERLTVQFTGQAAESAFATWAKAIGGERILKVRAEK